ncbi:MAG: metallophosphoesterase [Oscillospiraceae bacterium]|nr:metallophosphoesterase [Oscillospiraceae bacterium]
MSKTYVISDIHAHSAPLNAFLQSIREEDTVYVLGDVVDKGPDGLQPLLTVLNDPRCILLLGNHEMMMLEHLNSGANGSSECSSVWLGLNGGSYTMAAFRHLTEDLQIQIYTALKNSLIQTTLKLKNESFILVHAFPDPTRREVSVNDLFDGAHYDWGSRYVWYRGEPYAWGNTVIVGHTPTPFANGWEKPATVIEGNGWINIDCGLAGNHEGCSRLAALCLDDLRVQYFDMIG